MTPISLSELFHQSGILALDPIPKDLLITGVTESTSEITAGKVFVARKGTNCDGHHFLPAAAAKGACAAIVSQDIPAVNGLPHIRVTDTDEALGRLSSQLYNNPSQKLRLIGVTGTDGKSTTAHMIANILRAGGHKVAIISTIGSDINGKIFPMKNTTPPAPLLQLLLAKAVHGGCEYVVIEVSSHAVVQKRLAGCRFFGGVLTNVAADHLELHQTIRNYRATKRRFFLEYLAAAKDSRDVWRVLNKDDPVVRSLGAPKGIRTIFYSGTSNSHIHALKIVAEKKITQFQAVIQANTLPIRLALTGCYNVWNALAAAGAGIACGVSADAIQLGLESFKGVRGRFEFIECELPFDVAIDYAHTPQAVNHVMQVARQLASQRLIVVFGSPGDRWSGKRAQIGRIVGSSADFVVVTSDNPGYENPASIAKENIQGLMLQPPAEGFRVELDRSRAVEIALTMARPGDLVLLLGKGHEEFQLIKDNRLPFSERQVVRWFSASRQPTISNRVAPTAIR